MQQAATAMLVITSSKDEITALFTAIDLTLNLLYCCKHRCFINFDDNYKYVTVKLNVLHRELITVAGSFGDTSGFRSNELLSITVLLKQVNSIKEKLATEDSLIELMEILRPEMDALLTSKLLSYHRWLWWSKFCKELLIVNKVCLLKLTEVMIKSNFNNPHFIDWLINNMKQKLIPLKSPEQFNYLCDQMLYYKSFLVCDGYYSNRASARESLLAFIKTKLDFIRFSFNITNEKSLSLIKTNTSLSVPQLALLLRLMVESKIINETNQRTLITNIAAIMSTPKVSTLSAESLRINYYTPGNAAKSIVKDYLILC